MPKGRILAVVGCAALTLLCVTATAWAVFSGIAKLNLLGERCGGPARGVPPGGRGKGGPCTVCSGPVQNAANARTAKITYKGHEGETVRAARTPWGSYDVVGTDFVTRSISILLPVLPLFGTAGAGALTVREIRRARRPAASEVTTAGAE
ncbi:hypothetical protein AB0I51_15275 [Streptomyces sp. NPDC050549]|uniref:hypothetical protein n=1 Tax=Streptomyces sp. NPDC050549 TaxID=3155406 RepID=UPI0034171DD6